MRIMVFLPRPSLAMLTRRLSTSSTSNASVVATTDGGSWRPIGSLGLAPGGLGLNAWLALAVGTAAGPSPPCPSEVATSADDGVHWRLWSSPAGYRRGAPSTAGDTAVLVCPDLSSFPLSTTVLVSRDAGRTWSARRIAGVEQPAAVLASGSGQLWAYGATGTLWHSTDGGAAWSAFAPKLPVAL